MSADEEYVDREMRKTAALASRILGLTLEDEESHTALVCTALALAMLAQADASPVTGFTTERSIELAFHAARMIKSQIPESSEAS